jgi:hypothetical protein
MNTNIGDLLLARELKEFVQVLVGGMYSAITDQSQQM